MSDGSTVRPFAEGAIFDALIRENFVPGPASMLRRSVVVELGGFDEDLFVDDWDMWLRIADRYELRYLDECVVRYRLSPGGVSRSPEYRGEDAGRVRPHPPEVVRT